MSEVIHYFIKKPFSTEVDPLRLSPDDDIEQNRRNLMFLSERFLQSTIEIMDRFSRYRDLFLGFLLPIIMLFWPDSCLIDQWYEDCDEVAV